VFELDRNNPAFDIALELLALLTRRPIVAPLSLICEDLGLASYSELRPAFKELDQRGVNVLMWRDGRGNRLAAINHHDWPRAMELGEAYVKRLELS
jgi:hypothetical protein